MGAQELLECRGVEAREGTEHDPGRSLRIGARAGLVPRTRLFDALRDASAVPVILVVGGAGFGKTTLVSQWLRDDHRSVAWLTASREHDDPVVLLADIVRALDEFEPLEPRMKQQLRAVTIDFSSVLVPRLERTVAERARPFVLVIDDVHRLRRRSVWTLVQALADCVPAGSQLVLVARTEPDLALGRMRADRRVHSVTTASLAMDRDETGALFDAAGIPLSASVLDGLWDRTEGWPVGLYLASLALAEERDPERAAQQFAGDDRLVVDYVRDELLSVLPRRTRDFLLRASILDELSAPVCDSVLKRDDAREVLADASRSLQLLIPLDRRGEAFRMHQLMRDTLRAELARRDPEVVPVLHSRAARWYEAVGDFDRAVGHRMAAGDAAATERSIWHATPLYAGAGRTATVDRWLTRYTHDELLASPALTVAKAWCALTAGDLPSLRYWADAAGQFPSGAQLPDGMPMAAAAALLRAVVGDDGIEQMRADAARAFELNSTRSPYRSVARYLEGSALRIQGRRTEARERLEEGEAIGAQLVPATHAHCLAQLAALALEDGDWDLATQLIERYGTIVRRFELLERPAQGSSFAIAARVHARSGDAFEARAEAKHALFLLSMLSTVAPWITVESRIFLARAFLMLGDIALARLLVREGQELVALIPDGEPLRDRLADLERSAGAEEIPLGVLAVPMTPAEMRVLRYLPTHLTFAAIAEELFVSRNTVKTQAISIYRKLGVSSRDPAVVAARALGLLE
jgi:LuxR family transcriptional regulator, maltose regulon positive regulatory protein